MKNNVSSTLYGINRLMKKKQIASKYNIPIDQIIDLSAGDNLFIPPKLIRNLAINEIKRIDPRDRYPIDYSSFIEEISRFTNVAKKCIYPGISHITLIEKLLRFYTKKNDKVIILNPEKDIFSRIIKKLMLKQISVDLSDDYKLNTDAIIEIASSEEVKAILISSPHYPTGNQFSEVRMLSMINELDIPIIVDESYVEFGKYSLINIVNNYNNLHIIRNFSKAWGIGAFSLAYLVANDNIITKMKQLYMVEEIPPIHILVAINILRNPYKFVELIQLFLQERKRVYEYLKLLNGVKAFRTDSNFIFMQFEHNTQPIFEYLCSKGILVQNFDKLHAFKNKEKSLLVTLGTNTINDKFIINLVEVLEAISLSST
ncbi:MAG: aminotransferase class I/II-fold pyridoxal phosphate-dependent enzyme [Candidatus Heimdallarchaeum aukensis]|uniref:histidinol-phosphate transaminase n=1 Tax=Candidatus Heimdallarchaeum aukensis TaxID=2876573 RepID=A0A9Y1FKH1_9ARCH|nr:MAG: aminotransferase class I/II-fold pyridoxal phosphate-dependent enzyme [Candidatus Heimdallarchaeum aukensis]